MATCFFPPPCRSMHHSSLLRHVLLLLSFARFSIIHIVLKPFLFRVLFNLAYLVRIFASVVPFFYLPYYLIFKIWSIMMLNRVGLTLFPCHMPVLICTSSDSSSFVFILVLLLLITSCIILWNR